MSHDQTPSLSTDGLMRGDALRRAVQDSMRVGVAAVDAQGTQTYVNRTFCDMVGYTEAELVGAKPPFRYWPPEDAQVLGKMLEHTVAGQAPAGGFEAQFVRKNGERFPVLIQIAPLRDAQSDSQSDSQSDAHSGGWVATFQDATERKQFQLRLLTEHAVSRVLAESTTTSEAICRTLEAICETAEWEWGALWTIDPNHDELSCAHVWHRLAMTAGEFEQVSRRIRFSPGTGLPGRVWSSGKPAWIEDVAIDDNFPRKALAQRAGLHAAIGFPVLADGRVLGVMEFFSRAIRPPQPGLRAMMSSIGSLVGQFLERKRAEEALRLSEERWALAVRGTNDGIWDWNPISDTLYWSPRCKEMLGYADHELAVSRDAIRELIHPDDRERAWLEAVRHLEGATQHYSSEYRMLHKDGQYRWILSRGLAIRDERGKAARFVGSNRDVTEYRLADRERADLLEREKAARLEMEKAIQAKDEFLAVLSHELRTPLTPVLTAVQLMERDKTLTPEQYEVVAMIRRNVQLEARLIDDLLDLTRISRGKLELFLSPADVHQKIRHVVGICESEVRSKHLTLQLELHAREHHVMADAARLQQMIWNLLKNAIKFTPGGGTIRLRTQDANDGRLRLLVSDNGAGIPAELLPTIFEAFVQGGREITRQHGGLGLGLTISRRLAEMHGGTLVAVSEGLGKGSTFTLELPVAATPEAEQTPDDPLYERSDLESRILLVEDNSDTRRVMSKLLAGDGYDVRTADSVASALLAAEAESFDLLICDIGLPDGSGLDLMRQLLSRRPIKGIALSGFGMEEDVRKSKEAGFLEHLTKPVNLHHLEAVIRQVTSQTSQ